MIQKYYYVNLQLRTFSCKISSTNEKYKNISCLYSTDTSDFSRTRQFRNNLENNW